MSDSLFDLSEEYNLMLDKGLSISGESKNFFLKGRVDDLKNQMTGIEVKKILDFGCGIGDSAVALSEAFPNAIITGIDTSNQAIEYARICHSSEFTMFSTVQNFIPSGDFDLCYANGVFHHIKPPERSSALKIIHKSLKQGGKLALFENNPWNLGTRYIMSKIPFDHDAQIINVRECRKLLIENGYFVPGSARFLFYFPAFLKRLRWSEKYLYDVPLGAQYYHLGICNK